MSTEAQVGGAASAGSEVAVNAMKQGFAASTAAFDQFQKASKQVVNLADASVRAAPPFEFSRVTGDPTASHSTHAMSPEALLDTCRRVNGVEWSWTSDGKLLVATWDAIGGVYALENAQSGDASRVKMTRFAAGLVPV